MTDEYTGVQIAVSASSVTQDTRAIFKMELTESKPDSVTYEITLKDQEGNTNALSKKVTVTADIGNNLIHVQVAHNSTPMDTADYSYDRATGILTIQTASFSPFKITYEFDGVASVNGVAYPTVEKAALSVKDGDKIVLLKDTSVDLLYFRYGYTSLSARSVVVDLNGKTLTDSKYTNGTYYGAWLSNGASLTFKNGNLEVTAQGVTIPMLTAESGSSLILENVTYTATNATSTATNATSLFAKGDASKIDVKNSVMTADGYCCGTNAATQDNYHVVINIKDSTLNSKITAVYINVPGTLNMENTKGNSGDYVGVLLRGGTTTIQNCTVTNQVDGDNLLNYFDRRNRGNGNTVTVAALTFGNKGDANTAYHYPTSVTMTNTDIYSLTATGEPSVYPAISGYGNVDSANGATLTYDESCTIVGDIILGNNTASINGVAGPSKNGIFETAE